MEMLLPHLRTTNLLPQNPKLGVDHRNLAGETTSGLILPSSSLLIISIKVLIKKCKQRYTLETNLFGGKVLLSYRSAN